jgi:hypothetical protein
MAEMHQVPLVKNVAAPAPCCRRGWKTLIIPVDRLDLEDDIPAWSTT